MGELTDQILNTKVISSWKNRADSTFRREVYNIKENSSLEDDVGVFRRHYFPFLKCAWKF